MTTPAMEAQMSSATSVRPTVPEEWLRTTPPKRKDKAAALCWAMWRGELNAYLDDPAFKAEFERAAELVETWLAAAARGVPSCSND